MKRMRREDEEDDILGFRKPQKLIECPICHGLGTMVNDHDHAIQFNNFRGIAHAHCNLQYQEKSVCNSNLGT